MLKSLLSFPSNNSTADDAIARLAIVNVMLFVIMMLVMIAALAVEIERLKRITAPARIIVPIRRPDAPADSEKPASDDLAGFPTLSDEPA